MPRHPDFAASPEETIEDIRAVTGFLDVPENLVQEPLRHAFPAMLAGLVDDLNISHREYSGPNTDKMREWLGATNYGDGALARGVKTLAESTEATPVHAAFLRLQRMIGGVAGAATAGGMYGGSTQREILHHVGRETIGLPYLYDLSRFIAGIMTVGDRLLLHADVVLPLPRPPRGVLHLAPGIQGAAMLHAQREAMVKGDEVFRYYALNERPFFDAFLQAYTMEGVERIARGEADFDLVQQIDPAAAAQGRVGAVLAKMAWYWGNGDGVGVGASRLQALPSMAADDRTGWQIDLAAASRLEKLSADEVAIALAATHRMLADDGLLAVRMPISATAPGNLSGGEMRELVRQAGFATQGLRKVTGRGGVARYIGLLPKV